MGTKLTQARLKELLYYDPETGVFTWKVAYCKKVRPGKVAGSRPKSGYVNIRIDTVRYGAHRLAVLYMTGSLPAQEVDHANGVRDDNRWENLRPCTHAENHQNRLQPCPRWQGCSLSVEPSRGHLAQAEGQVAGLHHRRTQAAPPGAV